MQIHITIIITIINLPIKEIERYHSDLIKIVLFLSECHKVASVVSISYFLRQAIKNQRKIFTVQKGKSLQRHTNMYICKHSQ